MLDRDQAHSEDRLADFNAWYEANKNALTADEAVRLSTVCSLIQHSQHFKRIWNMILGLTQVHSARCGGIAVPFLLITIGDSDASKAIQADYELEADAVVQFVLDGLQLMYCLGDIAIEGGIAHYRVDRVLRHLVTKVVTRVQERIQQPNYDVFAPDYVREYDKSTKVFLKEEVSELYDLAPWMTKAAPADRSLFYYPTNHASPSQAISSGN